MMIRIKDFLKKSPLIVSAYHKLKIISKSSSNRLRNMPASIAKLFKREKVRFADGIPIPSSNLIFLVAGTDDAEWFLHAGKMAAQSIQGVLAKNGVNIEAFDEILDFGCGVGRVIRHFRGLNGPRLYGSDINPDLIKWCQKNLGFAQFQVNKIKGGLEYEDAKFDLVYALSVFTHLTEPQQFFWMDELTRILKPNGYLLITTHGDYYLPEILPDDRQKYHDGSLVVYGDDMEGSNNCIAFHPHGYVQEKMAKRLTFVDFIPEGALGNPRQDLYLFQK